MSYYKTCLIVFVCCCMAACISLNGSGYSTLSAEEKEHIKDCKVPLDSLLPDGNAYRVTATQVRQYLENHGDVVLYEYVPFCKSENCVKPGYAEELCKEKGYAFFAIAVTYDKLSAAGKLNTPLLVVDNRPYATDNYQKYNRRFYDELCGNSEKERGYGSLFYHFRNGSFVAAYQNIHEITKSTP